MVDILKNALEQQEAYQRRLDNQRKIINRYDGYRRWILEHVVPAMNGWADELAEVENAQGSAEIRALAQRTKLLGENPPEEWAQ